MRQPPIFPALLAADPKYAAVKRKLRAELVHLAGMKRTPK